MKKTNSKFSYPFLSTLNFKKILVNIYMIIKKNLILHKINLISIIIFLFIYQKL